VWASWSFSVLFLILCDQSTAHCFLSSKATESSPIGFSWTHKVWLSVRAYGAFSERVGLTKSLKIHAPFTKHRYALHQKSLKKLIALSVLPVLRDHMTS
jgi:hypothetical protein